MGRYPQNKKRGVKAILLIRNDEKNKKHNPLRGFDRLIYSILSHNLGRSSGLFSILFYPITLKGRRGTIDEFATIPFHLDLFSTTLVELAKPIPVHSLILSSHLSFCLSLFVFPFTVPCRIVFAKPEDIETWPNHLSFRFLTRVRFSNGCLDRSANLLIGNMALI